MSLLFSLWTVVVFVIFCGIVAWAWSPRRKEEFESTARMALDLDDEEERKTEERKTTDG